jgi:hypothetical protein
MMPLLRAAKQSFESSSQLRTEAEAIRQIALAGGVYPALKAAQARGESSRVVSVLKAAAPALTTTGGADVTGPTGFPGFQMALRTSSVFDAVSAEAMQGDFRVRVGMFSSQLTGAKVGEGQSKPGQGTLFASNLITPEKFVSLVVATQEFLDGAPGAMESLTAALQTAVGAAADAEFLADIAAVNNEASTGEAATLQGILNDLMVLLQMVDHSQRSSLFWILGPDTARAATFACMASGINSLGILGGSFGGVRVLVSDSLPANTISLIDATGLVTAATPVTISISREGAVQLDTAATNASGPTATATTLTSLFQTNSVGILAERSIGFAPLRPNSFASLSNVGWGLSVESPLP